MNLLANTQLFPGRGRRRRAAGRAKFARIVPGSVCSVAVSTAVLRSVRHGISCTGNLRFAADLGPGGRSDGPQRVARSANAACDWHSDRLGRVLLAGRADAQDPRKLAEAAGRLPTRFATSRKRQVRRLAIGAKRNRAVAGRERPTESRGDRGAGQPRPGLAQRHARSASRTLASSRRRSKTRRRWESKRRWSCSRSTTRIGASISASSS